MLGRIRRRIGLDAFKLTTRMVAGHPGARFALSEALVNLYRMRTENSEMRVILGEVLLKTEDFEEKEKLNERIEAARWSRISKERN